jgi:Arc/MetJ-type ribon-helix-helix transcriptional regulator
MFLSLPYSHIYHMVVRMKKTTFVLDERVIDRVRREAARSGRTMSEIVEAAIRRLLDDRTPSEDLPDLPTFRSGGHLVDVSDRNALYSTSEREP